MGVYVAEVSTESRRTDYLIGLVRGSGVNNIKVRLAPPNLLGETLPCVVCVLGAGKNLDAFKIAAKTEKGLDELIDLFFKEDISENRRYDYLDDGVLGGDP